MTAYKRYLLFFVLCFTLACKHQDKVKVLPVGAFFKSQDKIAYRISPDGTNLSYLKLEGKNQNLYIENIATGKDKRITQLKDKNINFYFWVSRNELIYYKEFDAEKRQSDLFIINKDGSNERQLTNNETSRIKVLEDQLVDDKYLLV